MENSVELDPQQYIEEWFNVAILLGKEFELPDISGPPFSEHENVDVSEEQPSSCRGVAAKYTFDLNESLESPAYDDVYVSPCKKARQLEPKNESNSVGGGRVFVDLNEIAPECAVEFDDIISVSKHQCFICYASFTNGNALGGHMSSHAKQKKREAITCGNVFGPGSFDSTNLFGQVSDIFVAETRGTDVVEEDKSRRSEEV